MYYLMLLKNSDKKTQKDLKKFESFVIYNYKIKT